MTETTTINQVNSPISKSKRDYTIEVVDNEFVLNRWQEIESTLSRVFSDSNFNDNFVTTRPAEHTWQNINDANKKGLKHIIALDLDNNILGAFLVIPSYKPEGKEDCDLGWMFTIELYPRFRHEVMSAIVDKVHEVTRNAGFKRIITEMGTEAGAKFLCKKHGYVHTPNADKLNRWTKELN
ncbi:MAG: hypothetical protein F6J93_34045 [Oscillatoria sp. SIO1A7]|nr:hypothetical protein [Oscillatoria sp. SIO1A7]